MEKIFRNLLCISFHISLCLSVYFLVSFLKNKKKIKKNKIWKLFPKNKNINHFFLGIVHETRKKVI